jgi:hypothetical protein
MSDAAAVAALRVGHLARIDQGQDVRVLHPRRDVDLAQEPLGAEHGGEIRPQDLERDRPLVAPVVGEIVGRMPPRPSSRSSA